jgi:hypothetical protein
MGKYRRGGYVFITWKGDHPPRHVHVYRGRQANREMGLGQPEGNERDGDEPDIATHRPT